MPRGSGNRWLPAILDSQLLLQYVHAPTSVPDLPSVSFAVDWMAFATAGGGADEAGRSVCCHGGADGGPGGGAVRSEMAAHDTCQDDL